MDMNTEYLAALDEAQLAIAEGDLKSYYFWMAEAANCLANAEE